MKIRIAEYQNPLIITISLVDETNRLRIKLFERYFIKKLFLSADQFINTATERKTVYEAYTAKISLLHGTDRRDALTRIQTCIGDMVTGERIDFTYTQGIESDLK